MAAKAGVPVAAVTHMSIWGNHSTTMFPDYENALVAGRSATEVIGDPTWFERDFVPAVQNRGSAIIKARGQSSAASAANAVIDSVRAVHAGTGDDWMSLATVSRGEYGVQKGLVFSFPVQASDLGHHVVQGLRHSDHARSMIEASEAELIAERDAVRDLTPHFSI